MNDEVAIDRALLDAAVAGLRQALIQASGRDFCGQTLYFVSRRETADALVSQLPQNAVIATSHWQVEQVFRAAGFFVIPIEEFLTPDLAACADRFIQSIVRGWYVHKGRDFTIIDRLSLGKVHEYELLHCQSYPTEAFTATHGLTVFVKALLQFRLLLETTQPTAIEHDVDAPAALDAINFAAAQFNVPVRVLARPSAEATSSEPLAPIKQRNSGLSVRDRLARKKWALMRAAHHWQVSLRRATAKDRRSRVQSSVFLVPYSCLELTAQRLKERLHHVYIPNDLRPGQASEATRAALASLQADWQAIKATPEYQQRFCFLGMPCFPHFETFLGVVIADGFPATLNQAASLEKTYRKLRVQAVLVPFDEPNFARLCVLVAQRMGIAAVVCEHGALDFAGVCQELMTAENVCVISEWDRIQVAQQKPSAHMTVIGCLQLDKIAVQRGNLLDTASRSSDRLRILVLTLATDTYSAQSRTVDSENYLTGVIQALQPFAADIHVTFKLHPAENRERYEADLAWIKPPFSHDVSTGWRLPELLPHCDLVIAPVSTGVVEALFLGKPVIHYRATARPVPLAFDQASGTIRTALNPAALTALVTPAVKDYPQFLAGYDFARALSPFGPQDGHAADRVIEFIHHISRTPHSP